MCRNAGGSKASAEKAAQRFRAVSEAYEILGNGEVVSLSRSPKSCEAICTANTVYGSRNLDMPLRLSDLLQRASVTYTTGVRRVVTCARAQQPQPSSTTALLEPGLGGQIIDTSSRTAQLVRKDTLALCHWADIMGQPHICCQSAGISANLAAFLRGMTKYDAYFHLLLGGVVVGGFLFMGTAGEAMWASMNRGVTAHVSLCQCPLSTCIWFKLDTDRSLTIS